MRLDLIFHDSVTLNVLTTLIIGIIMDNGLTLD